MTSRIHRVAAVVATATVLTFLVSSVAAELFGGPAQIAQVKRLIVWGLLLLGPAMAATGATGVRLAAGRSGRRVRTKLRRTLVVAANGALVLVPSALFLDRLARRGDLGRTFMAVQAIELVAGVTNLLLMALNVRDGLRLGGEAPPPAARGSGTGRWVAE
jgi:hypothetical protein